MLTQNHTITDYNVEVKPAPLLDIRGLKKHFPVKKAAFTTSRKYVKAVDDVSFKLFEGETYGLVGESGCGKSTTGRTLLKLIEPTDGQAFYRGEDILKMKETDFKKIRKEFQMIFQDPYSSLNPRKNVGNILEEPLIIHGAENKKERFNKVIEIMGKVNLTKDSFYKHPHEFSGGQRQRIGIGRAFITNPNLVICDEPVSALDVSVQSQIINLMSNMQEEFNTSYLFIAHDMSVVRHISERIGVMYLGSLVEEAPTEELISHPLHPYTEALISAIPSHSSHKRRERIILKGEVPSPINPPSGCVFRTRCPYVMDICKEVKPVAKEVEANRFVKCHLY